MYGPSPKRPAGAMPRNHREIKMAYFEKATATLASMFAQIVILAAVMV
jgi:hypothetical protein